MKGTVYGFKRSLKNCHLSLREEPNDSHLNANVCVNVPVCVLSLYVSLLNVCTFSYKKKKKKLALMHIDRLFRSLSPAPSTGLELTVRTVEGESPLAGLMHNCTPH